MRPFLLTYPFWPEFSVAGNDVTERASRDPVHPILDSAFLFGPIQVPQTYGNFLCKRSARQSVRPLTKCCWYALTFPLVKRLAVLPVLFLVRYRGTLQGVIYTPRGVNSNTPNLTSRTTFPALSPNNPPNISHGVLKVTVTVHTCGSYSSTLILHSLCIIKHDRNVLFVKRFFCGINVTLYFSF